MSHKAITIVLVLAKRHLAQLYESTIWNPHNKDRRRTMIILTGLIQFMSDHACIMSKLTNKYINQLYSSLWKRRHRCQHFGVTRGGRRIVRWCKRWCSMYEKGITAGPLQREKIQEGTPKRIAQCCSSITPPL